MSKTLDRPTPDRLDPFTSDSWENRDGNDDRPSEEEQREHREQAAAQRAKLAPSAVVVLSALEAQLDAVARLRLSGTETCLLVVRLEDDRWWNAAQDALDVLLLTLVPLPRIRVRSLDWTVKRAENPQARSEKAPIGLNAVTAALESYRVVVVIATKEQAVPEAFADLVLAIGGCEAETLHAAFRHRFGRKNGRDVETATEQDDGGSAASDRTDGSDALAGEAVQQLADFDLSHLTPDLLDFALRKGADCREAVTIIANTLRKRAAGIRN